MQVFPGAVGHVRKHAELPWRLAYGCLHNQGHGTVTMMQHPMP